MAQGDPEPYRNPASPDTPFTPHRSWDMKAAPSPLAPQMSRHTSQSDASTILQPQSAKPSIQSLQSAPPAHPAQPPDTHASSPLLPSSPTSASRARSTSDLASESKKASAAAKREADLQRSRSIVDLVEAVGKSASADEVYVKQPQSISTTLPSTPKQADDLPAPAPVPTTHRHKDQ